MVVSIHGGTPKWENHRKTIGKPNSWLIRENPKQNWMMAGGTAIDGNHQIATGCYRNDGWCVMRSLKYTDIYIYDLYPHMYTV